MFLGETQVGEPHVAFQGLVMGTQVHAGTRGVKACLIGCCMHMWAGASRGHACPRGWRCVWGGAVSWVPWLKSRGPKLWAEGEPVPLRVAPKDYELGPTGLSSGLSPGPQQLMDREWLCGQGVPGIRGAPQKYLLDRGGDRMKGTRPRGMGENPPRKAGTRPKCLVTLCWPGGLEQLLSPFGASVFKSVE